MRTIWKYRLATKDRQDVLMPQGAEILTVQVQGDGEPCLWTRVDAAAPQRYRRIVTCGTGHAAPDLPFIGTYQVLSGAFVWHVFDGGERA